MNKISHWILGLVCATLIIAGFFGIKFFVNLKNPTSSNPNGTLSPTTLPSVPDSGGGSQVGSGNTFSLLTANGKTILVKDFTKDSAFVKDPVNPGYFYLGYHYNEGVPDPTASNNPPYVIEYIASAQYFTISLLQEPIKQTRIDAEKYLMKQLNIPQSQMCLLKYMVAVPARVNSTYAGTDLRFDFCDGETPLP